MFGVSQMNNDNATPSKPTVRRARPVHSCLDCRNRKLKCDRGRPCGQCSKAGRPGDCHYDSTAGSMSRNDGDTEEPSSKRRRTENIHDTNGYANSDWGMHTPASVQYGAYGTATMPEATMQRNSSIGPTSAAQAIPAQVAAQQAYMSASMPQRYPESSDGNAPVVPALPTAKSIDKMGIIEDLQARVTHLEKLMKVESAPKAEEDAHSSRAGAAEVLVDLKRSHSSAMNPKRSIMHQFEDLLNFYKSSIENSTAMDEVHKLRAFFPKSKQPTRLHLNAATAMEQIVEMIPPSGDCDRLLKIYLNTWDPVHQILDLSNFLNDYNKFWRRSGEDQRSAFTPALLLVVAIGSSLDDASQSQRPNFLNDAISYVETWLADLSNKRQKDVEVLCVHALLVIAMQTAAITPDRIYRMTGSLARSAMLMGLHYDPRVVFHKTDERQIQHRRRLWTSIVELDLQASLMVGVPSAIRDTDLRVNATILADDGNGPKDVPSASISQVPAGVNPSLSLQATPHPPLQMALARTLKTRLLTAALTLDVYPNHDFAVMRQKINQPLPDTEVSSMSQIIADTFVQRSILAITRAQCKAQNHRVMEGFLAGAHSCMAILQHLDELDPNIAQHLVSKRGWEVYMNLFGNEVYRSSFILCLVRKLAANFPPYTGAVGEFSGESLIAAAEGCVQRLLKNLDNLGDHFRDLLALTLAIESVRPEAQKDDATRMAMMKQGFENFKAQLFERRPLGSTAPNMGGSMPGVPNENSPNQSSAGHTPLGEIDFQFLANSFNFDLDFGFSAMDPALGMGGDFAQQQAINFGGMQQG